jgi:hypothetical protein
MMKKEGTKLRGRGRGAYYYYYISKLWAFPTNPVGVYTRRVVMGLGLII